MKLRCVASGYEVEANADKPILDDTREREGGRERERARSRTTEVA